MLTDPNPNAYLPLTTLMLITGAGVEQPALIIGAWDLRWRKESRFGWLTYTMKLEQDINKLTSYYCRYGLLLIYRLKITPGREGKANNLPLWLVFNTITSIIANNKNLKEERVVATLGVFWGDLSGKTPLGKKLKKELFYIMMKMLRCTILYNDENAKMLLTVNKLKLKNQ